MQSSSISIITSKQVQQYLVIYLCTPFSYLPHFRNLKMMSDSTTIDVEERSRKGPAVAAIKATTNIAKGGIRRGLAIFDFILRICVIIATLAAAAAMGTTDETLPFFTQFFQFQAQYDDLPAFQFFVIANAISAGYFVLSLPFAIVSIVRSHASGPRVFLIIFDTIALALTTAAAASSAAIVYLAHNGNSSTNWIAICQQFGDFCQRVSGATVGSFIAVVIIMVLVMMSAVALRS